MGFFDFLFNKKDNGNSGSFGFVSGNLGNSVSIKEAHEMRDQFLASVENNDINQDFTSASALILKGAYNECIETYEILAKKYPSEKGVCESQIGACHYFLGDYDKAIKHYVSAREYGMRADMMDDNIWEACLTLYHQEKDKIEILRYIDLCPDGDYISRANKLLNKVESLN